ncbi:MAG: hypothetical protein L0215_08665 [Gemmataceae bacterium]|nr:hypothetical protein [Gemmataceae bacterium]
MAIHFQCPHCQTPDSCAEEMAGKEMPCRWCGAMVTVPPADVSQHVTEASAPPPAPPWLSERAQERRRADEYGEYEDEPEADYRLADRAAAPGWGAVRIALGMMFWSLIAMAIGGVAFFALSAATVGLAGPQGGRGIAGREAEGIAIVMLTGVCGILIAFLICFIGQCMCCAAPAESRARGLAIGSLICTVLVVLVYAGLVLWVITAVGAAARGGMMAGFPNLPDFLERGLLLFVVLAFALLVAAHILFILFLRTVALYFGNDALARSTMSFLVLYLVLVVLYVVVNAVQFMMAARGGFLDPGRQSVSLMTALGCAAVLLLIAVLVWFLVLLARTREMIGPGAGGRRY